MHKPWLVILALLFGASSIVVGSFAKPIRWASQGDILTMDPHSQNEGLNNTFSSYIYEALVTYDKKFQVEPNLAVRWTQMEPTRWRFELRQNVKFHDGAPLTVEDVIFSIERALAPTSNFKAYTQGISGAKRVDDKTVDIMTQGPNPVLLRQLTEVRVMSKAWCEKHRVTQPQNFVQKEETYAARNANGTGPYILKSREVDVRTVLVENPAWWGKKEGNVSEIIYTPIKADATRTAALLSGEIDFVLDPAPQDVPKMKSASNIKVVEGAENRTIFIGMDQSRDELLYSSVKGKNPFKDVRVRQALYHAVDIEGIRKTLMRGASSPTGAIFAPQVHGWSADADKRLPYDVERARKLLAEAGYSNGFEVTLDCPNNRYINDEEICQALTAMWAKIGLKVSLNAMPRATYFPKIQKYDTSLYLLGWGVPTFDALYSLQSLARTVGQGGDGNFNLGRYSNPKLDELVDRIKTEVDANKRTEMIRQAHLIHNTDVAHIPLHNQVIPWAMKRNVNVVHRADNRLEMRWARID